MQSREHRPDQESEKSSPGKEVSLSQGLGAKRACCLEEQKEGRAKRKTEMMEVGEEAGARSWHIGHSNYFQHKD